MSVANKLLQAAAGNASDPVYVDDVYSTFLYTGNSTNDRQITNGIDLSGEGGLVWIKMRESDVKHRLHDTERGINSALCSNNSDAVETGELTSFNNNGFSLTSAANVNTSATYVSWTFRKQEKFFDVVTWTGTGSAQNISHNLGVPPGAIFVKCTSSAENWLVYHQAWGHNKGLNLNTNDAKSTSSTYWNGTAPTSTQFSVGTHDGVNKNTETYVAYLFAGYPGSDGGDYAVFGEDSDEEIIKCGSYTGNGNTSGKAVTLGFEPQWILIKGSDSSQSWLMLDTMRGWIVGDPVSGGGSDERLFANLTATADSGYDRVDPTATGFNIRSDASDVNNSGETYIYIAIRRPHKPASEFAATDLYKSLIYTGDGSSSKALDFGFSPDLMIGRSRASSGTLFINRLAGIQKQLTSHNQNAENTNSDYVASFDQSGITVKSNFIGTSGTNQLQHGFRRAKGFFDVVTYDGTGSDRTQTHNLGVAPELILIKRRTTSGADWVWYVGPLGAGKHMYGDTGAELSSTTIWSNTAPTASVFSLGNQGGGGTYRINGSGSTYIAYLFATVAGISKVGTYTGTGSDLNVDCGFSAGARFILIKRTDSTGGWYVYDSVRGIVAGNDPYVFLNATDAEVTNTDYIDPLNAGFTVTSSAPAGLNASSGTYIFLAIA